MTDHAVVRKRAPRLKTRKSGKTFQILVRSLTDSAYFFDKRGPSGPRFFLRLISSETCRDPPPAPRAKRTGQHAPRRTARRRRTTSLVSNRTRPRSPNRRPATGEKKRGAAEPILTPDNGPRTPDRGRRTGKKRHGARGHRVIFSGQKISGDGQIFAARRVAAQVLVPCFSQIIM